MITVTPSFTSTDGVRFADMIPGKLYRLNYDNNYGPAGDVSSLLGLAGVTITKRKTFTVLNVKQGVGLRCDDKVGATWTGREFETAAKDFFPADDVTVAINNDVTA